MADIICIHKKKTDFLKTVCLTRAKLPSDLKKQEKSVKRDLISEAANLKFYALVRDATDIVQFVIFIRGIDNIQSF